MRALKRLALIVAFWYMTGAFISASLNLAEWAQPTRVLIAIAFVITCTSPMLTDELE